MPELCECYEPLPRSKSAPGDIYCERVISKVEHKQLGLCTIRRSDITQVFRKQIKGILERENL